ncbi:MAG: Ig-like domain-containing protein [Actinomycetota bacterium]
MSRRFRFRPVLGVVASLAVVASVVVLASQADGRPGSEARSNDGGAWLVDREWGGVAHVEYLTRQPTVRTLVADPDSTLSVTQAPGVTAVHNRSSATVSLVDTANAALVSDTAVPAGAEAVARPDGLVVHDADSGTVWNLPLSRLAGLSTLEAATPTVDADSGGALAVGVDGTTSVTTDDGVLWIPEEPEGAEGIDDGDTIDVEPVPWPDGFSPRHQTVVNGRLVATDSTRWLTVGADTTAPVQPDTGISVGLLQQPNDTWPLVAGLDQVGGVWVLDLVDGTVADLGDDLVGVPTARPVFHDRCLHALSGEAGEIQFTAVCLDGRNTIERGIDIGDDAELRLVNGFVWIDVLDGSGFVVTPDLELEEIVDFSIVFQDEEQEESPDGDEIRQELAQGDPDAELIDADEPDREQDPEPPVAVDDEAGTRAGRPVYVDVLANDSDPNADVILIDGVELVSGEAEISFPASRNGLQISPQIDEGTIEVRYWITDGDPRPGHRVSALVTVDVLPLTEVDNRPPEPGTDRLTGAVASVVTANLLDNDRDPDGDTIQLLSIDADAAPGLTVLSSHPGGGVILALPETLDGGGSLTVPYTIADEWGAEAVGTIDIELRLAESNIEPDARNDAGVTQVGNRISLNLLLNDTDADNDPLSILQPATPIGGDVPGFLTTSEDGEFTFEPEAAGTYQFQYSVTDRQASDIAIVRIEVIEPEENDPPVAVRDDAVLARGETRLVPVLDNDGDPDGDVIGIVSQFSANNPNIKVVEQQGIGFWVTLQPGALPVETFFYRVSDGLLESELAQVVITRSDSVFTDAAPIVTDDQFRVRPGRTSRIDPLRNDYDPEGGPLTIVSATSTTAEATVQTSEQGLALDVTVPDPQAVDAFAITYVVADEAGNESAGEMEVALVPPGEENSPPVARSDRSITTEGQAVIIPVLANDSDPESDPIDLEAATVAAASGGVELGGDGRSFVYTPAVGFRGTDQFTYLIRDAEGATAIGSVTIGVLAEPQENRPPVATPDLDYAFAAGSGTVVLDVIDNDFDPDGDPLAIIDVNGDARLSDDGVVTFPIPDELRDATTLGFTYEISDFRGGTDTAEVRITVAANIEPIPPVATPDSVGPVEPGTVVTVDVLANDTDPDGEPGSLTVTAAGGGATVVGDGVEVTAPDATADVSYTITDTDGLTDTSFITIAVEENLPPEVTSPIDLGEFFNDDTIPAIDLSAYASDPDGDDLVFANVSGQIGGTTLLDSGTTDARRVTFVPSGDHLGPAGFAFTVDDGNGHVVSGRVNLTLLGPSNTPPTAQDGAVTLEAGVGQPFSLASLFTDPDPDDTLTYSVVSGPEAPVTLSVTGDTASLDAPISSGATTTTFVVEATDSDGESATATVTVTLTETQVGPPQATPDTAETNQEQAVTVDVLSNDIDTLGQGDLALVDATSTQGATSVAGPDITFTPADGFFGTATVIYTIADGRSGTGGTAQGTLTVDVIGRPSPPAAVTANPLPPRSIAVSWQAPAANGSPITNYQVEVTVGGSTSISDAGTSPSLTLTNLQPGEPYRFRVRAANAAGDGEWSASTGDVVVDQVPSPPGTPTVTYGDGQLAITWPAAANEGSAIGNYNLEISQCASEKRNVGNALSYTWTGLANGSRCAFSVTAVNLAGESSPSPLSALECPASVPAAPGAPGAVRGDKQASVTWSQPTNPDCEGLLGYEVRRSDGAVTSVPAGTVSWTSAPLTNGTSYSFEVRAQNRAGWGPWSSPSATVIPCGTPLAPPAPTATRGDTQATVTRNGEADANGCAISQYQVSVNGGGWSALPASGVITGLTNGTSYSFRIRAVNEIGPGDAGAASNTVVPAGPPTAPGSPGLGGSGDWVWGAAGANGDAITAYQYSHNGGAFVSGGFAPGATITACRTGTTTSSPICQLSTGGSAPYRTSCIQVAQTVTLQVRAVNSVGTGPTATGSASIPGCPAAPVATFLNPSQGGASYGVSWTASSGATAYYIVESGGTVRSVAASPRVASCPIGTPCRVAACNSLGCRLSNEVP